MKERAKEIENGGTKSIRGYKRSPEETWTRVYCHSGALVVAEVCPECNVSEGQV